MYRILRLSLANIRRHKTESVLLAVLVMLCMTLLAGSLTAERNILRLFPDMMERTASWPTQISISSRDYDLRCEHFLEDDERVLDWETYEYLFSYSTRIPDENGREKLYPAIFSTEENERKAGRYAPQTTLTAAEIAAMEHPAYVPLNEKSHLHLHEGDTFTLISGAKQFRFTVAGFYECGFTQGTRFVVSDADYAALKALFDAYTEIGLRPADPAMNTAICQDFENACKDAGMITDSLAYMTASDMRANFDMEVTYILKIIEVMAVIILIAVGVMIGFRIVNDIRDQIVSIGVLEALGYRSGEIACAYAAEYFLIALTGCIAGTGLGLVLHRVLVGIAENMKGYSASHAVSLPVMAAVFCGLLLIVTAIACIKAASVRKYPPVQAFRKGIRNHHFGRSHFPLRKTRSNVHLRLALKGFADHAAAEAGLTFVMSVTTFAVVLSFILYSFLGRGLNTLYAAAGHELSDLQIMTVQGIDSDAFRAELEAMPEIRKVIPTSDFTSVFINAPDYGLQLNGDIYRDFAETENITPMEGRLPVHENEVMLTKAISNTTRLKPGDSITLEYNNIRRDYLITGLVTALLNSNSVYITEDGIRQMDPLYEPNAFQVYRSEGTDTDTLRAELDRRFGKSAESLGQESTVEGTYEERIKARADQIMAAMVEQNGATNVEYAIRVGDNMITGNSSGIKIRAFMNLPDLLGAFMETLCTAVSITTRLFMAMAAAVVMMILSILMASEVRSQRRSLGIMKGLGYTSRELMLQLAFRIMPSAFAATVIGTVLAVLATSLLVSFIGNVPIHLPAILVLDLAILAFCFVCAYLGARSIKKISVYELMTE